MISNIYTHRQHHRLQNIRYSQMSAEHQQQQQNYKSKINKNKTNNTKKKIDRECESHIGCGRQRRRPTFIECQIIRWWEHGIQNKEQDCYRNGWWEACVDIGSTTQIFGILFFFSFFFLLHSVDYSHFTGVWTSYTWYANKLRQMLSEIESHFTFGEQSERERTGGAHRQQQQRRKKKKKKFVDRFSRVDLICLKSFGCIFYIIIWSFDW